MCIKPVGTNLVQEEKKNLYMQLHFSSKQRNGLCCLHLVLLSTSCAFFQRFTFCFCSTVVFLVFYSVSFLASLYLRTLTSAQQNIYKLAQLKLPVPKDVDINQVTAQVNKLNGLENQTALHLAIEDNHLEAAAFLLMQGADVNFASDTHPQDAGTPLHYASTPEAVKLLLDHGADLDSQAIFDKTTPIYEAIARQDEEAAYFLLKKGADLNRGALDNQSVFDFIAKGFIWLLFDWNVPWNTSEDKSIADMLGENLPLISAAVALIALYPKEASTPASMTQLLTAFTTSFAAFAGVTGFKVYNKNNDAKKYLSCHYA